MSTDQMTLPSPFEGAPLPETAREYVDISPEPGAPDAFGLFKNAGRQPWAVPAVVATYVNQQKQAAATTVAKEFQFHGVMKQLEKETSPYRATLDRMDNELAAAKAAGANRTQLIAIGALQLAPRAEAKAQIAAAVERVAQPVAGALFDAERAATQALDERPGAQPTEDDYATCGEISLTLDLLPPPAAVKVLMQRLVLDPAKSGKVGLTTAMLPLLRAKLADKRYDASVEFHDLIQQAEIVTRNAEWHAAHLRLRTAGGLRYKLEQLTRDATRARRGVETVKSNAFYKEFGAAAQ